MTLPESALPPLTVNPRALSAEHHLLRRLNDQEPTSLALALRGVRRAYPDYGTLGTPEHPTATARNAWARIAHEDWTRSVRRGDLHGLVLTGLGEAQLARLWELQVRAPYLRALAHSHGPDVARRAALELR